MVTKIAPKNDLEPSAKDAGIEKTIIRISSKRQITIPSKYFEALGFDKEIECIKSNGMLILIPLKSDESYFAEEILKDLISQGYSGDKLLAEFKKSAGR
jgi:bifunctional DNA-binding transcriptional regulator/antitoxin component of YhaV-PrlF toxin-antitoxin module